MRRTLSGRRILITGAARGIGEKVARLAAARGARMALVGLEPDRLRTLSAELGAATVWREADVRDGAALQTAIDECADAMGGIDALVANAGVVGYGTVRQTDDTAFARVLDINVNGVFRTLKSSTPHLHRSRGHAVVVASAISFTPLAGLASYAASKAGVEMLALAYRQEVVHLGITVGLVHPSWIDTDLVRGVDADLPSFRELRSRLPYPGNVTTSVDDAAAAIVRGVHRRRRRVYVPRAVGVANWGKAAVNSPVAWPWVRRMSSDLMPTMEREVDELGRQDQPLLSVAAHGASSASTAQPNVLRRNASALPTQPSPSKSAAKAQSPSHTQPPPLDPTR
ncbi:short-chain dehydrogenase/reductase [Mycobacterium sp. CPCC 205372]|uniref:Short-chain dehydrogenase/reductase n=1 Tax=Mycobacterium hippophais TaxID=3016340 RepID=A0ABT4PX45_9MYCO|nr:short-chain dehydrogenase/reductase [Mycobacterium hippophais]MCZ8381132.1 short-chain dehydrogenase/reductase [Mycobacterium hippophais]